MLLGGMSTLRVRCKRRLVAASEHLSMLRSTISNWLGNVRQAPGELVPPPRPTGWHRWDGAIEEGSHQAQLSTARNRLRNGGSGYLLVQGGQEFLVVGGLGQAL
jgi:hypothetical protein